MDLVFRMAELVILLEWALDLIDLYDKRLADVDGPEAVHSEEHIKAKKKARKTIEDYKQMLGCGDDDR